MAFVWRWYIQDIYSYNTLHADITEVLPISSLHRTTPWPKKQALLTAINSQKIPGHQSTYKQGILNKGMSGILLGVHFAGLPSTAGVLTIVSTSSKYFPYDMESICSLL